MDIHVTPFRIHDEKRVLALLSDAELPTRDLNLEKLQGFLVARQEDDQVVGVIGMEVRDDAGLLRSLVVHPNHRSTGLGRRLVDALETVARDKGLRALYLLTTTAPDFFEKSGYRPADRQSVPRGIADTQEFKGICPSTSVCLFKPMSPP